MRRGEIDAVIVGADRITHDAVFNKIGTCMHAVCAHHHGIPSMSLPLSPHSIRRGQRWISRLKNGAGIELALFAGSPHPGSAGVCNPAFDATPLTLVDALITDIGVIRPPYNFKAIQGIP